MLKDLLILIGTFVLCLGALFGVVATGKFFGIPPEQLSGPNFVFSPLSVALVMLALLVPVLIIVVVYRFYFAGTWPELGFTGKAKQWLAVGLALGILIQAINLFLKYVAAGGANSRFVIPDSVAASEWSLYATWVMVTLLLNSFSEELVFRVFPLYVVGRTGLKPAWTILTVSLAFSIVHFLTSEATLEAFLFRTLYGVLFCQLFLKTRSLWFIVGAHTGSNLLALFFSDNWKMGGFYDLAWISEPALVRYSFTIVLTVAIAVASLRSRAFVRRP